jgi:bacillolysin/neutral peptidase B
MFHGVTDSTARLEYAVQSGALNESYSDIFGIIIANFSNPDPRTWSWKVGEGLSPSGKPFRDMRDPTLFGQPDHMDKFKVLPNTQRGDWGGVHTNSGIHNKAAFNILTAPGSGGSLALTPQEVAGIFYLALTQQLSRTSQFSDSRRGVLVSARTLFRTLPPDQQTAKLAAITNGFTAVGIT